jgi:hypothetical protein
MFKARYYKPNIFLKNFKKLTPKLFHSFNNETEAINQRSKLESYQKSKQKNEENKNIDTKFSKLDKRGQNFLKADEESYKKKQMNQLQTIEPYNIENIQELNNVMDTNFKSK